MDVDKIEAGESLDVLIAEKVMGWIWWTNIEVGRRGLFHPEATKVGDDGLWRLANGSEKPYDGRVGFIPTYSTSIEDAWRIVDHVRGTFSGAQWERFCTELCDNWNLLRGRANGDAPLFICRAALKAVEGKNEQG